MNATQEQWLPVVGFEGLYEISDWGRVKSVERKVWFVNRWGQDTQRIVPERIRELSVNPNGGHLELTLHREGKRRHRFVHQLVLDAFVGPYPDGLDQVRHLDGDPTNNRLDNLRYGTAAENVADMLRHGTQRNQRKTHCVRGHAFDDQNTYFRPDKGRDCKRCWQERRATA